MPANDCRGVGVIDTTLRDAHQCLWATRMTTAMMLPVAGRMDRCGFAQIDLAGTIQFDVCVRFLREDPWQRVRLMRERVVNTPLRSLVRSKNLVSFDILPDDIIELWVERLVANGFRVVGAFDGLNDLDNMLASIRVAKKLGVYAFGALSYSLSPVHTDELYVRTARALIKRGKVDAIMLKDAGGLLTVDRIRTLVPKLKRAIGNIPLELHSHCLTGVAPLVYLEGIRAGADQIHSSIAPLANGAAQPSTQSMARNLRAQGHEVNIDDALIEEVGEHFRRVAEQENKPLGQLLEYDAFHYEHQVPGGMMSNFKSQLAEAGLAHKFQPLLEECARVRKELGYPIMITPFSQLVGTQAVFNVVHGERYRFVPDEVKKYALGYYGKLLAPVAPDVLDRIIENGSNRIPRKPEPLAPAVKRLREQYPSASDDERILRYMFAGPQVDDMLAAGAMKTSYRFENPLVRLVRELAKRPRIARVRMSGAGI
ncbi:MAG: pyruvate carboxylase subunit B [Betaproteobacteria bacterium]|nr:pyruvate carboxylase subunit B [Betaproteobacteria bacterium]